MSGSRLAEEEKTNIEKLPQWPQLLNCLNGVYRFTIQAADLSFKESKEDR